MATQRRTPAAVAQHPPQQHAVQQQQPQYQQQLLHHQQTLQQRCWIKQISGLLEHKISSIDDVLDAQQRRIDLHASDKLAAEQQIVNL